MRKHRLSAAMTALILIPTVAHATSGTTTPTHGWQVSRSLRTRIESWGWFDPGSTSVGNEDNYVFMGQLFRAAASRQGKRTDSLFEIAIPLLFALPNDAVAAAPQGQLGMGGSYRAANGGQVVSLFVKQASLTFKGVGKYTNLRVGRFEFVEGMESLTQDPTLDWIKRERIAHRLIGNFGFSHVQRSADGIQLTRNTKGTNVTFVVARPTVGVFDLDGNKEIKDVDFVYVAFTRKGSAKRYDGRLFYILYNDDRNLLKTDNRSSAARAADTADISISTLGGHYARKIGKADILAWSVWQRGEWGTLNQDSWAWNVEIGCQPSNTRGQPWLRIGTCRSSGDGNSRDEEHETFFQILPTPRLYARFPFFNIMNTRDDFAQIILRPNAKATLRADYHRLRLSDAADLWYVGGGAFQQGTFGYTGRPSGGSRNLANMVDVSIDYKASANTTFTLYYGRATGRGVVRSLYAGDRAALAYIEVAYRF